MLSTRHFIAIQFFKKNIHFLQLFSRAKTEFLKKYEKLYFFHIPQFFTCVFFTKIYIPGWVVGIPVRIKRKAKFYAKIKNVICPASIF